MTAFDETVERLREIAEQLRDRETTDEQAEALAREAADLVSQAGGELERALRDDTGRP